MANKKRKPVQTATEALKLLWANQFFKAAKLWQLIEKELNSKGYNFSSAELGMALKRAKYLTRRGNKKKYEYIQRYPFAEDGEEE